MSVLVCRVAAVLIAKACRQEEGRDDGVLAGRRIAQTLPVNESVKPRERTSGCGCLYG